MIVIDTSAVIAILQDEAEAEAFQDRIAGSSARLIAAPTKLEMLLVSSRRPNGPEIVRALIDELDCEVVEWTDSLSDIAFDCFLRYGKARHPAALNFGDCMAHALAKSLDVPLLFKGDDFSQTDIKSAL